MTTDAAGFVLPTVPTGSSYTNRRKKSYYTEEEDIEVKPSTELIPDEYDHTTNESVLFHIFRNGTYPEENLADELIECVQKINYSVNREKNVHGMNNSKQFFKDLETIRDESADKNALLIVFIGYFGQQDGTLVMLEELEAHRTINIKDIWNMFSPYHCPGLKYKPKIFIFCTSKKPSSVQTDSMKHRWMDSDKIYDFPAEADMLIVYKKVDDPFSRHREIFLNRFCNNIAAYSKQYDIIDLISYINNDDEKSYPLIISTLTRKFYLTPSTDREHFLSLVENNLRLEDALRKIHSDVEKLQEAQKKKKEKKFSFSFKKKSEDRPKIAKKKEGAIAEGPSKQAVSSSTSASTGAHRLSSGSNPGRRTRQTSETDHSGAKGKPLWKY